MRTRLTAGILAALLSLGLVACDDTVEGIEEDAEQLDDGVDIDVEGDVEGD